MSYIDETPLSVVLEQSYKYTSRQLSLLHSNVKKYRDIEIINLYDRAYRLNDVNALECIVNRYPINLILQGKNDGLPESSEIETKQAFDEIFNIVSNITGHRFLSKAEKTSYKRQKQREYRNIKERLPGGKYYRNCFIRQDNNIVFLVRNYLYMLPSDVLLALMNSVTPIPKKIKSYIQMQQIDWFENQDGAIDAIIQNMIEYNKTRPMPIDDVKAIQNGEYIVSWQRPRY